LNADIVLLIPAKTKERLALEKVSILSESFSVSSSFQVPNT
jgi:hypothetical protein